MVLPAEGGSAAPKRQISDAELIAQQKRELAQARFREMQERQKKAEQQRKSAAAKNTKTQRKRAETGVNDYNRKVRSHQQKWVNDNRGKFKTREAAQKEWRKDWEQSNERKEADRALEPLLAGYSGAVQHELRLEAAAAGSDPKAVKAAVEKKLAEIKGREKGGLTDKLLDDIITPAAKQVGGESPELRQTRLDNAKLFDDRDKAASKLKHLQDTLPERQKRALDGVNNGWLRQEIAQGFQTEIDNAQQALDDADAKLAAGLKKDFSLTLADKVLTQAKQGLEGIENLPPRLRKNEYPEAQRVVGDAEHQRKEILAGRYDQLKYFTSEQIDAALKSVFAANPELTIPLFTQNFNDPNFVHAANLFAGAEALKLRPTLDTNMAKLPSIAADPKTPEWMKTLIEKDKPTAALIASLKVEDGNKNLVDIYKLPLNASEQQLAKEAPIILAMLKFAGGTLTVPASSLKNPQPMEIAKYGQQSLKQALDALENSKKPQDRARLNQLQLLVLASGDVRTDYLRGEWQRVLATESPQEGLDKILKEDLDEKDFNNPNYTPHSEAGKFLKTLSINMQASFTPEQQMQIWDAVGGDVTSFLDQQASILKTNLDKADKSDRQGIIAAIGEWQMQMAQFAPAPVAAALIDDTTSRFDPTLMAQHGGGRMVDGVQLLGDRAGPAGAMKLADWATRPQDGNGYPVPLKQLLSVKKDGTGTTLGQALLSTMEMKGVDPYSLADMQSGYDATLKAADKKRGEDFALEQHKLFNEGRQKKLQDIFDGAIKANGDVFTQKLKFGNDPASDNKYGRMLNLQPDNPGAGNGALYTDPKKLEKIHLLKQIDWISRGADLPVDLQALIPRIVSGGDLPDDPNLQKINKLREQVREIGGDNPIVTFTPMIYHSKQIGVTPLYLMRVEGDKNNDGVITRDETTQTSGGRGGPSRHLDDEDMIIDTSVVGGIVRGQNLAWSYDDVEDFRKDNTLDDDGKLYFTGSNDLLLHDDDGDGRVDKIKFDGVDAAITTAWEHTRRVGDIVLGAAGIIAGGALIIGTGGLAAPLVAAGAAAYFGFRTLETADEMSDHGQSFNPINTKADGAWFGFIDPAAGGFWLGGIASVSGVAALRPLALGRSLSGLSQTGAWVKGSNNVGRELFLRSGTQTQLYRTQLGALPRSVGITAEVSGGVLTVGQGQDFVRAWSNGEIDWSDWSLHSSTWDFALMGGGLASLGGGYSAMMARRGRPGGGEREDGADPTSGQDQPVRYVAHFDAEGNPSLGLLGPDGRTTADVDAPWVGQHPAEVLVAEMVTGPDGRPVGDAIHRLTRNADGTYSGVRLDADGGVTRYTTDGGEGAHPLTGIQLRNAARRAGADTDPGTPAQGAPFVHTAGNGGDIVPIGHYRPATYRLPKPTEGAEPPAAGGVPPGGRPPVPPRASGQPDDPSGGEPLDLGFMGNVDPAVVRGIPSRSRGQVRLQGPLADRPLADGTTVLGQAFRILENGGTLIIDTGLNNTANPAVREAIRSYLQQLGFEGIRFFGLSEDDQSFGRVRATKPTLPGSHQTLMQLLQSKIAIPERTAYKLYSEGEQIPPAIDISDPRHLPYLQALGDLGENRPAGSEFLSQVGRITGYKDGRPESEGTTDAAPLIHSLLQGNEQATYPLWWAARDFFHYLRAGADPNAVSQRIYINADPKHATEVMGFIVRSIVDAPGKFPGVDGAKIAGSHSAANRRENIIIYVDTVEKVLTALDEYAAAHPGHFRRDLPLMTEPVRFGVAIAEEPSPAMVEKANNILGRNEVVYSFGGIRTDAIEIAFQDTLAQTNKQRLDASDLPLFARNVAAQFIRFGIDPADPSRNLPESGQPARTGEVEPNAPVAPARIGQRPSDAELALRYSGLQVDSDWGLVVRDIDPQTNEIRVIEVNETDPLFFDPASRQTFGHSRHDGTPSLQFADGARVYHPGTNREYVFHTSRGRFEPLLAPADSELYYNPGANVTFLRDGNGALELFGRGDNTEGAKTWAPSQADPGDVVPANWQYDEATNRTYAPDDEGVLQPLDPEDILTHYNKQQNVTYLIVPETGKVLFFGRGDNTDPNLPVEPGRVQQVKGWLKDKIGDKRLGVAGRAKFPGIPSTSSGATEVSSGRSLGTKTGPKKPHKSDRFWEFRNAPLAFLTGFSNQEALQFKGSTFKKEIQNILNGKGDKSPFQADVVDFKEVGAYDRDPSKTVIELSLVLNLKTNDATLARGEKDFFGSRGKVRELPYGIPFNKVMSEIKVSLPLWARALIASKLEKDAPGLSLLILGLRPGGESRPEISISGIPAGAKVSQEFATQVQAALSQSRVKLQVVTDNPAELVQALKSNADLDALRGHFEAEPTLIFVDRGPRSGMRLSSVTGQPDRLRITDLAGMDRHVMNDSQMNLDVIFNKRKSLDYWADRAFVWPLKRGLAATPLGQRWSQSRFGGRLQPQPHFTPGEGIYRRIRDANQPAQRRLTIAVTPLSVFGIFTGEIRAASKSPPQPDSLPKALESPNDGLSIMTFTRADGAETHIVVPNWLAELTAVGHTGQGVVWPKGAGKALQPVLTWLDTQATGATSRPEAVAALAHFRNEVLPTFKEGSYLSPKQVDELIDFLEAQG